MSKEKLSQKVLTILVQYDGSIIVVDPEAEDPNDYITSKTISIETTEVTVKS